jgi:ATP adenylyltransferase
MNPCHLCSPNTENEWNATLMESPNFRVLPSLGALVEGWVLILPKPHFLSMGKLPSSLLLEMRSLKNAISTQLNRIYGPVYAFEHGPGEANRKVGCGVDHAHLHLVPLDFDLLSASAAYLPDHSAWREATFADCQAAAQTRQDYVYLEEPRGRSWVIRDRELGSQLLRRAIATRLGAPNEFNWRSNPQIENVRATLRALAPERDREQPTPRISEHAA